MEAAEELGGYTANFIGDVADYVKCNICMMVLREPVMLVECGHKFCTGCFNTLKKHVTTSSVRCPVDRGRINCKKVFPDKAIKRVILDLLVKCDYWEDGCVWSGELRKLATHLKEDCIFDERRRNSTQLRQHKNRIKECERLIRETDCKVTSMKKQNESSTKNFQKIINRLHNEVASFSQQLKETQKELKSLRKEHKHKQGHSEANPRSVTQSPFAADIETEISTSMNMNEVAVAEVTSTQDPASVSDVGHSSTQGCTSVSDVGHSSKQARTSVSDVGHSSTQGRTSVSDVGHSSTQGPSFVSDVGYSSKLGKRKFTAIANKEDEEDEEEESFEKEDEEDEEEESFEKKDVEEEEEEIVENETKSPYRSKLRRKELFRSDDGQLVYLSQPPC